MSRLVETCQLEVRRHLPARAAFMGLTADQLITAWATRRKHRLGIAA
ncbi:hypothetical protein [Aminobacter sp. Piv2-1]